MTPLTADSEPEIHGVDLSQTPAFHLGDLEIRPSTRIVRGPSSEILAEPRVLQVLIALTEADGAVVSRDGLIARCWGGRIVGEDAINRSVAKARHLAELSTPPAFCIETIPRVGYRLKIAEAAPDIEQADDETQTHLSGPKLDRRFLLGGAAGAGVLAAVAGASAWRLAGGRWRRPDPLVAVLPFDNLSADPQLGYFADGLSEDILNVLTRSGGVRVTARSSSFTFRGAAKGKAAAALGAGYILDGSVLRDGDRLRVNAHLSDAHSGETLWSDAFDRGLNQGLQIEDEIAGQVASSLKVRLTSPAPRLIDPMVYDLYLKGRDAIRSPHRVDLDKGVALLREAVRLAPDFAPAWFELAKPYWRDAYLHPLAEQERGFELGRQAAERAVSLDPRNGAAVALLAQMLRRAGNWDKIEAAQKEGLRLSPGYPELRVWRGWFLFNSGRLQAAAASFILGQSLDPLYFWSNTLLVQPYIFTGQFKKAEAAIARVHAIWPEASIGEFWQRFWLIFSTGQNRQAAEWVEDSARRPPSDPVGQYDVLAAALRAADHGSSAARKLAGQACLAVAAKGMIYATTMLLVLPRLGLDDEAVELARAIYLRRGSIKLNHDIELAGMPNAPEHGETHSYFLFHPVLAPLRHAGRLNEVFDGLGLTAFWRSAGRPD